MKKLNVFQKVGVVLLFALVTFSVAFSTYELCFDKAEASLFSCGNTSPCKTPYSDCGVNRTCTCTADYFSVCWPGSIVPEQ